MESRQITETAGEATECMSVVCTGDNGNAASFKTGNLYDMLNAEQKQAG
jgi:hypothetical protein